MLHGLAQLVEHGADITLLYRGLTLDEVGQLVGLHEFVVIHGSSEVLTESRTVAGLVCILMYFCDIVF